MRVQALGHAVLKVRNLERALTFYAGVLGMPVVARATFGGRPMAFFSVSGNHHDLALAEVGEGAPLPGDDAVGLAHIALKVGDSLDDLRAARARLRTQGIEIDRTIDHRVAQSLYIRDPDGNRLELYVDADSRLWRDDPSTVAHSEPFDLS